MGVLAQQISSEDPVGEYTHPTSERRRYVENKWRVNARPYLGNLRDLRGRFPIQCFFERSNRRGDFRANDY